MSCFSLWSKGSLCNFHCRNILNPFITGGHKVYLLCDTFISMCSALTSFQTKDSPLRKMAGGQIDKVILAQNTTDTHLHRSM